ncbi:Kelch repeat-containing protein [Paenibacillus medicaginis]|uniref:Kelch repeat-containing protein n=1 Tax=Paenibacillus medicaginis TaxID=1470560 RepID=A0ABV5C8M9_9BACL
MKKYVLLLILVLLMSALRTTTIRAAEANEWVQLNDITEARTAAAVAAVDNKIYIFGGSSSGDLAINGAKTNTTYVYDVTENRWGKKTNMPTARAAATAAVVNGKIYVIGGYNTINNQLVRTNVVEMYDPKTDTWEKKAPLHIERSWAGSTVSNGLIYVFGGGQNNDTALKSVEVYDPTLDQWTEKNSMPFASNGIGVTSFGGKIYIAGGTTKPYNTPIYIKEFWEYDPATDVYSKKPDMLTERTAFSILANNDKLYFIGSVTPNGGSSPIEIYDVRTETWSKLVDLTSWRFQSSAVMINNEIFIIGGTNGSTVLNKVEKYSLKSEEPTDPTDPPETPEPEPSDNRAILVVTMTTGLEKEFDLSMKEINDFIAWYEAKQAGSGKASYAIDKHENNKGPFSSRKDYILYDRVLTFEVSEY